MQSESDGMTHSGQTLRKPRIRNIQVILYTLSTMALGVSVGDHLGLDGVDIATPAVMISLVLLSLLGILRHKSGIRWI